MYNKMNTLMKICSDCRKELELESFPYDKSRDRYLSVCKSCTTKRTQAYRLKIKINGGNMIKLPMKNINK